MGQAAFPELDWLLLSLQLVEKVTAKGNIQPTWQRKAPRLCLLTLPTHA